MAKVLIRESYGSEDSSQVLYVRSDDQTNSLTVIDGQKDRWISFSSMKMLFTSVFLPAGYPDSVSTDYLKYQIWDSIQAFASSIMNGLGTHAILKGVGVGDSTATVLAATITWILRDGTSMIGRILFTYHQSSKLDSDCKKWRLFADLTNDVSIMIDLLSPYFSQHFLYMQCISGVLKSLVGTAGGATRAALTQHQSRRNNLADVSAKDGSQETLVNLTALIYSQMGCPFVWTPLWPHLMVNDITDWINYRAVRSVSIEAFNMSRFAIFVDYYLKTNRTTLSVQSVNTRENVWFFIKDQFDVYCDRIAIGVSIQCHMSDRRQLNELIEFYTKQDDCPYVLSYEPKNAIPIKISLERDCDSMAILSALFQALLILFAQKAIESNDRKLQQIIDEIKSKSKNSKQLLEMTKKYTINAINDLKARAPVEGWDLTKCLVIPNEWRYEMQ